MATYQPLQLLVYVRVLEVIGELALLNEVGKAEEVRRLGLAQLSVHMYAHMSAHTDHGSVCGSRVSAYTTAHGSIDKSQQHI